jgi:hypothetical protein
MEVTMHGSARSAIPLAASLGRVTACSGNFVTDDRGCVEGQCDVGGDAADAMSPALPPAGDPDGGSLHGARYQPLVTGARWSYRSTWSDTPDAPLSFALTVGPLEDVTGPPEAAKQGVRAYRVTYSDLAGGGDAPYADAWMEDLGAGAGVIMHKELYLFGGTTTVEQYYVDSMANRPARWTVRPANRRVTTRAS